MMQSKLEKSLTKLSKYPRGLYYYWRRDDWTKLISTPDITNLLQQCGNDEETFVNLSLRNPICIQAFEQQNEKVIRSWFKMLQKLKRVREERAKERERRKKREARRIDALKKQETRRLRMLKNEASAEQREEAMKQNQIKLEAKKMLKEQQFWVKLNLTKAQQETLNKLL
jgi:hypothetical protein